MRIGVGLDGLQTLSRDILTAVLAAEPDFQIVRVLPTDGDPVARHALDALVLAIVATGFTEVEEALLAAHPRLRLVGIESDGRTALLMQLRPHREKLTDFSPQALIELLRLGTPGRGALN